MAFDPYNMWNGLGGGGLEPLTGGLINGAVTVGAAATAGFLDQKLKKAPLGVPLTGWAGVGMIALGVLGVGGRYSEQMIAAGSGMASGVAYQLGRQIGGGPKVSAVGEELPAPNQLGPGDYAAAAAFLKDVAAANPARN